jgi:hypothetical protein
MAELRRERLMYWPSFRRLEVQKAPGRNYQVARPRRGKVLEIAGHQVIRAQGSEVGSKHSIGFQEFLTFTTIWGICFRSISNPSAWNRSSSDTVLAQLLGVNPFVETLANRLTKIIAQIPNLTQQHRQRLAG